MAPTSVILSETTQTFTPKRRHTADFGCDERALTITKKLTYRPPKAFCYSISALRIESHRSSNGPAKSYACERIASTEYALQVVQALYRVLHFSSRARISFRCSVKAFRAFALTFGRNLGRINTQKFAYAPAAESVLVCPPFVSNCIDGVPIERIVACTRGAVEVRDVVVSNTLVGVSEVGKTTKSARSPNFTCEGYKHRVSQGVLASDCSRCLWHLFNRID